MTLISYPLPKVSLESLNRDLLFNSSIGGIDPDSPAKHPVATKSMASVQRKHCVPLSSMKGVRKVED